jgi:hypothetical protein
VLLFSEICFRYKKTAFTYRNQAISIGNVSENLKISLDYLVLKKNIQKKLKKNY